MFPSHDQFGRHDRSRYDSSLGDIQQDFGGNSWGDSSTSYDSGGDIWADAVQDTAPATFTTNDIVNIAVDFDNEKVWWGKNGTWQGTGTQNPATNQGGFWFSDFATRSTSHVLNALSQPHLGFGVNLSSTGNDTVEFRYSEDFWTYTPPSGFDNEWTIQSAPSAPAAGTSTWNVSPVSKGTGAPAQPIFGNWEVETFGDRAMCAFTGNIFGADSGYVYNELFRSSGGGKYYAEVTQMNLATTDGGLMLIPLNAGSPSMPATTLTPGS